MLCQLQKGLAVLNCATSYFVKQYTLFNFLSNSFASKSSLVKGIWSIPKPTSIFLQHQRSFKTMECCGNSCGLDLSKEALKKKLTSMQYQVTQEKETERAFTGKYHNHFEKGTYPCIVCDQDLFSSEAKFESKCGWPSFFDVMDSNNVKLKSDLSHLSCNLLLLTMKTDMKRTEVTCSKCGSHLGHVFDDGPKPTGKRYCINSAALNFKKAEEAPSSPDSTSAS